MSGPSFTSDTMDIPNQGEPIYKKEVADASEMAGIDTPYAKFIKKYEITFTLIGFQKVLFKPNQHYHGGND